MKATNSKSQPNHGWTTALVGEEKTRPTKNFTLVAALLGLTLVLAPASTSAITGKIIAQLSATDSSPNSFFGAAIAISADGKTIAVAAPGADTNNGIGEEVYVYEKPAGGWTDMTQFARLYSLDCPVTGAAGASIAITPDGSTIVYQCNDIFGQAGDVGPINVFIRPASGWQDGRPPNATFSVPGTGASASLAIDPKGDTIATTSTTFDPNTTIWTCFLYLFEKGAGWANNMAPTQTVSRVGTCAIAGPVAITNDWVATTHTFGSLNLFRRSPIFGLLDAGSVNLDSDLVFMCCSVAMSESYIFASASGYLNGPNSALVSEVYVFSLPYDVIFPLAEVAQLFSPIKAYPPEVAASGRDVLFDVPGELPALFVEPFTGGWQTTSQPNLSLDVPTGFANVLYPPGSQYTLAITGTVVVSGDEWAGRFHEGAAYVYRLKR